MKPVQFSLFLALIIFTAAGAYCQGSVDPPVRKDLFGHPVRSCPCRLQKTIETAAGKKTEVHYTYNAAGQMTQILANEDNGAMHVFATISYNKDGLFAGFKGFMNMYGMQFFYGADNRLEKVTYRITDATPPYMETINYSYVGDSIVQAVRRDAHLLGTEYITTYTFDKAYNITKAARSTKTNIDETVNEEMLLDYHPDTYNYAFAVGSDIRFFGLFFGGELSETIFMPASTYLIRQQSHIDYSHDRVRKVRNAMTYTVKAKNKYGFPTSFVSTSTSGDPETQTEAFYECK